MAIINKIIQGLGKPGKRLPLILNGSWNQVSAVSKEGLSDESWLLTLTWEVLQGYR